MDRFFFIVFCIWSFVLLGRPQDIFPVLEALSLAKIGAIILLFYSIFGNSNSNYFTHSQLRYFAFLVIIMIIGIPFSFYPKLSFEIIFFQYSIVVLFSFVFYKIVDSKKRLSILLLVGCLGNGLYTMAALLNEGVQTNSRLSFSGMFDPNDLAFFTLVFLPLNLIFISRDNPIWMRLACLCSFFFGTTVIALSGSRGGMLAFCIVIVMLLFLKSKTIKLPIKIILFSICALLILNPSVDKERFLTLFSIEDDYNVSDETGRIAIWTTGVRALIANPITGVGVQCFNEAVGRDRERRGAETLGWQTAHNSVVQIATETGFGGLFLFLLISLNMARIFNRIRKEAINEKMVKIGEMGLLGFTGMFVSSLFLSQAYSIYWVFYICVSAVMHRIVYSMNKELNVS